MTMLFQRADIELMAPVGNRECLYAAIQGGANSVYFGVDVLNMPEELLLKKRLTTKPFE